MKVVTVREFRDRATEMLRSEDVILITRDGLPARFFLPWGAGASFRRTARTVPSP